MANKSLPGAPITVNYASSTGSTIDSNGLGDVDISINRPGQYPWLDVGKINFSAPTQSQLDKIEEMKDSFEKQRIKSNIARRMSRDQAELVTIVILKTLSEKFSQGIPPDDEIEQWRKDNGY